MDPFARPIEPVVLRPLDGTQEDVERIQRVLEAAPTYARMRSGETAGPHEAQDLFDALPEGKSRADKFVFAIESGTEVVGCVDLIRRFPAPHIAHIGLLLIGEAHQSRGVGRAAFGRIEAVAHSWHECTTLRLNVLESNAAARAFWSTLGFVATGEGRPHRSGPIRSSVLVFTKALQSPAAS